MKRKLIGLTTAVLTLVSMAMAKEKTVNDGSIGRYVTVEMDTTGTKNFNAVEEVKYRARFPKGPQMVKIPEESFEMMETEVFQELYMFIMGENPSYRKGDDLPVENVSFYDAIMFCNKLSVKEGLIPVYAVDGNKDTAKWSYTPHRGNSISKKITVDADANGYCLPSLEEWEYAAKGGENYEYAGSNNLDEVAWYNRNSESKTHPVGLKKANGYGLYDMSGNVNEWCWTYGYNRYYDEYDPSIRCYCGGSYYGGEYDSYNIDWMYYRDFSKNANNQSNNIGFRVVRSVKD